MLDGDNVSDKPRMPVEAGKELYALYLPLCDAVTASLRDSMAVTSKYGVPNGAAIKPWAEMIGSMVGYALAPLGLAPSDIEEIAALTAAAVTNGEAMTSGLTSQNKDPGKPPADPSLN